MSAPEERIYAAHLYPRDAIPGLLDALEHMRRAQAVLFQLTESVGMPAGSPADDALSRLDDAISMMEPDTGDESTSENVAVESSPLRLAVDNTRGVRS